MRVLVAENNGSARHALVVALRGAGLAVDVADDLLAVDEALMTHHYQCVVLDRILSGADSIEYLRNQAADGSVPILVLSSLRDLDDRVVCLEHGEDYLQKPFAMPELVLRVRNLCRRAACLGPRVLRCGDIELDRCRHEVQRSGRLVPLSRKEFCVLEQLMIDSGRTVSRTSLFEQCWDEMADVKSNALDVTMTFLRRKLGQPSVIRTVRGFGYRVEPISPHPTVPDPDTMATRPAGSCQAPVA
ncbi:response regulator transcription factor [Nocardia sp. NBC_00511]|uniref:response regulator transcription factor n=1 Tax=Nocardia sp. NBC_00511 TaxID=2903591 RepID=UPI0030E470E9